MNRMIPRILIVEDEAVIAMEIEMRLIKLGYEVTGLAASGERAIQLAAEDEPNIALMDINLSGPLDGIQTATELRKTHDIPIVFLTAYSDTATIERACVTAPLGYLTKPFSDRDVHAAIEVALYRHALDRELLRSRQESERLVEQLRLALSEVKTLKELLPVCASCKKIRDDEGYWSSVDSYLVRHGLSAVTHSICPDCMKLLYPNPSTPGQPGAKNGVHGKKPSGSPSDPMEGLNGNGS